MKLYMKQKAFSWRDKFVVWDEQECKRWSAQGEVFTLGRKLHVYDAQEREAAFINKKLLSFRPRYFIQIGSDTYSLVKEFTLLRSRFRLENADWVVGGDFWAHEYEVTDGAERILSLSRRWFTWGDRYELDIPRPENELLGLCVALAIDCINADSAHAGAGGVGN